MSTSGNNTAALAMIHSAATHGGLQPADGYVTFEITFKDLAGNGTTYTSNPEENVYERIWIDNTPPEIESVSFESSGDFLNLAKTGDTITVNFIANEPLQRARARFRVGF